MMKSPAVFAALTVGAVVTTSLAFVAPAAHAADDVHVRIAAITDFHGHLEMAPNMAAQLDEMRAENPDTLFLSTGDSVGGSAYVSSIAQDEPTMEILSHMGLQYSGLGNHEFDKGYSDIVNRQIPNVSWRFVNSNITGIDASAILPYAVEETQGIRVGIIGALTEDLPNLVDPKGIEGLSVSDPVAALDATAAELKDGDESNGEADVVVALLHEDYTAGMQVGADVDAVVAGHSHVLQNQQTGSGAPVVQPDSFGKYIGDITIAVNPDTKKVTSSSVEMRTVQDALKDPSAAADPEVKSMVSQAMEQAKELGKKPVGTITGTAKRGTNGAPEFTENRGAESTLGNLIAQGFFDYAQMQGQPVDFAIQNAGGLRSTSIDPDGDGVVTIEESYNIQPFDGQVGTIEITPAQVYELLEQQWKPEGASRPMLRLGLSKSIAYAYDPEAPLGNKVLQVNLHGTPLDRTDTTTPIRVASGTFLLNGGDGYEVMKQGKNLTVFPGINDLEAFNTVLRANPGYVIDHTQRSFGITGPTHIEAGQELTYRLSSLAWTTDEPNPDVAQMLIDGTVVGSAPIDTTVTPLFDETGTAEVTIRVPADLSNSEHVLMIKAGDSAFSIPMVPSGASDNPGVDAPGETPEEPSTKADAKPQNLPQTGGVPFEAALILLLAAAIPAARRALV